MYVYQEIRGWGGGNYPQFLTIIEVKAGRPLTDLNLEMCNQTKKKKENHRGF